MRPYKLPARVPGFEEGNAARLQTWKGWHRTLSDYLGKFPRMATYDQWVHIYIGEIALREALKPVFPRKVPDWRRHFLDNIPLWVPVYPRPVKVAGGRRPPPPGGGHPPTTHDPPVWLWRLRWLPGAEDLKHWSTEMLIAAPPLHIWDDK